MGPTPDHVNARWANLGQRCSANFGGMQPTGAQTPFESRPPKQCLGGAFETSAQHLSTFVQVGPHRPKFAVDVGQHPHTGGLGWSNTTNSGRSKLPNTGETLATMWHACSGQPSTSCKKRLAPPALARCPSEPRSRRRWASDQTRLVTGGWLPERTFHRPTVVPKQC